MVIIERDLQMKLKRSIFVTGISLFLVSILSLEAAAANKKDFKKLKKTNECVECDLTEANLQKANKGDLAGANLAGADLTGANLEKVNLI